LIVHCNNLSENSECGLTGVLLRRRMPVIRCPVVRIMLVAAVTCPAGRQATFSACFHRPFTITSEVAGTVLTTDVTCPNGLFSILGEVPRISRVLGGSHFGSPSNSSKRAGRKARYVSNGPYRVRFCSTLA
jgi:hypothetical protein